MRARSPKTTQPPRRGVAQLLPCRRADRPGAVSRRVPRRGGWEPGRVGVALTFGGLVTVAMRRRPVRRSMPPGSSARSCWATWPSRLRRGDFDGAGHARHRLFRAVPDRRCGPFLGPTLAAITLGIVGPARSTRSLAETKPSTPPGNVATALLIAGGDLHFGYRAIFSSRR